jgi:predicted DNA-binding transcriptional regulator AlpA
MDCFRDFLNESIDIGNEHEILNMYKDRYRYKISDISELTGISVAGIYRILEKYGISPHRAGLQDNHALVNHYAGMGLPAIKISELTGYSKRQVYNIMNKNKLVD